MHRCSKLSSLLADEEFVADSILKIVHKISYIVLFNFFIRLPNESFHGFVDDRRNIIYKGIEERKS